MVKATDTPEGKGPKENGPRQRFQELHKIAVMKQSSMSTKGYQETKAVCTESEEGQKFQELLEALQRIVQNFMELEEDIEQDHPLSMLSLHTAEALIYFVAFLRPMVKDSEKVPYRSPTTALLSLIELTAFLDEAEQRASFSDAAAVQMINDPELMDMVANLSKVFYQQSMGGEDSDDGWEFGGSGEGSGGPDETPQN
ncbi:MAG: hypothetical protein ACXABY_07775 [Candidatus Thorarchaeota archaeon]